MLAHHSEHAVLSAGMARSAGLIYVLDTQPGIKRRRYGKGWKYYYADGTLCSDEKILLRIKKLAIPPAWKSVWICKSENGHLQATGFDARQRKQYKYHADWQAMRNETKFHKLYALARKLPEIKNSLAADLASRGLTERKVLALVVKLMEQTAIRVGNNSYEKLYGSYGLTTLKDEHVEIRGAKIKMSFIGKKGIRNEVEFSDARLAKLVKKCRDIPGQELFQYYDETGKACTIDSGKVNNYIKEISGYDFTAKDFRTWRGTLTAVRLLAEMEHSDKQSVLKKNVLACFDGVSKHLSNTKTVCRKYYIHPAVISFYESGQLHALYKKIKIQDANVIHESVTLKILESAEKSNAAN